MNRREALRNSIKVGLGTLSIPSLSVLFESCGVSNEEVYKPINLSYKEYNLVWHISEVILPRTSSPGADDVGVAKFIDLLFSGYLRKEDTKKIIEGLQSFSKEIEKKFGKSYSELDANDQINELIKIDKKAKKGSFFKLIKNLILWGYFTSEGGMRSMDYKPVPGRHIPCTPLNEGTKYQVSNRW